MQNLIICWLDANQCVHKLHSWIEVASGLKVRSKWGRKLKKSVVLPKVKNEGSDISLTGPFSNREIEKLFSGKEFESVDFRECKFIDLVTADEIAKAKSIRSLSVWSKISRSAFSRLMHVSGLKEVFVLDFAGSGRLRDFRMAADVEIFLSYYAVSGADMLEIANLPKLKSLTAHSAEFGVNALERLVLVETLRQIDFEAVTFTDEMAAALSKSKFITDVVLPATQLSRAGLQSICEMTQLRYLDIWANGFIAGDLDLLAGHPTLEIIELGDMGVDRNRRLRAFDLIPKLDKIPSLNTVYFENVVTSEMEAEYLNKRYKFRLMQEA